MACAGAEGPSSPSSATTSSLLPSCMPVRGVAQIVMSATDQGRESPRYKSPFTRSSPSRSSSTSTPSGSPPSPPMNASSSPCPGGCSMPAGSIMCASVQGWKPPGRGARQGIACGGECPAAPGAPATQRSPSSSGTQRGADAQARATPARARAAAARRQCLRSAPAGLLPRRQGAPRAPGPPCSAPPAHAPLPAGTSPRVSRAVHSARVLCTTISNPQRIGTRLIAPASTHPGRRELPLHASASASAETRPPVVTGNNHRCQRLCSGVEGLDLRQRSDAVSNAAAGRGSCQVRDGKMCGTARSRPVRAADRTPFP